MTWRIGIDEAGYGPNLGPLVMTSVACQVPEALVRADLWQVLSAIVGKFPTVSAEHLIVDDSKLVYSSAKGLECLERSVLSFLTGCESWLGKLALGQLLDHLCREHELCGESWFTGNLVLPQETCVEKVTHSSRILREESVRQGLAWGRVRSLIVCPERFNDLIDRFGSKGAVLAWGFTKLLKANLKDQAGPMRVVIDKHGGRNRYSAIIQEAVPEGFVVPLLESGDESLYEVIGLDRGLHLSFRPRADASDLCVALASMVSKYLREVLMKEFNHFWQGAVPGLAPTAGYPGDARRFFEAIEPTAARMGLRTRTIWRER